MRRAGYVDILKALCAFLVVCIHAPFPGIVGDYFTALSRVAVPIFFMITGYYYAYTVKQNKSINQIILMKIYPSISIHKISLKPSGLVFPNHI